MSHLIIECISPAKYTLLFNEPLDNRVYFAGEINDAHRQMGVPGAILSGYFAINDLLMNE